MNICSAFPVRILLFGITVFGVFSLFFQPLLNLGVNCVDYYQYYLCCRTTVEKSRVSVQKLRQEWHFGLLSVRHCISLWSNCVPCMSSICTSKFEGQMLISELWDWIASLLFLTGLLQGCPSQVSWWGEDVSVLGQPEYRGHHWLQRTKWPPCVQRKRQGWFGR